MFSGTFATDPVLGALSATAGSLVARLRGGALAGAPVDSLGQTLTELRRIQAQLDWAVLQVVREVDLGQGYRSDGALSAKSWLTQRARYGHREAADTVAAARALSTGALDATSTALADGQIDLGHAVVIARGTLAAPDGAVSLIEPFALAEARGAEPGKVAAVMRDFRTALDPDDADRAALRRYQARGLSTATTLDGSLAGRFLLDPAVGATLLTALHAGAPPSPGDTRTAAQRRADALGTIAGHFLGTADLPRKAGARPHVITTVHAADTGGCASCAGSPPGPGPDQGSDIRDPVVPMRADPTNADSVAAESSGAVPPGGAGPAPGDVAAPPGPGGARVSWIGPIPQSTAERIGCDAHHVVVQLDPDGEVTGMTRQRRYFTWNQQQAIIGRDGDRCAWPHCDRPIWWSDGHHIVPVSEGGPTTVSNGALPCEAHHVLLHEGHWRLHRLPDGRYLARHPSGREIGPEPTRRPHGTPANGKPPTPHQRE